LGDVEAGDRAVGGGFREIRKESIEGRRQRGDARKARGDKRKGECFLTI
jgi:hypothetical protein